MTDTATSQSPTSILTPSTLSSSIVPTGTRDSAPGSSSSPPNNHNNDDSVPGGMASYYFVFLMLTLCIIGIVVFLNFRRRRKRRLLLYGRNPEAFSLDPAAARGRRYWQGRGWGSQEVEREEGLNEQGEAPPPYVPKRPSEEVGRAGGAGEVHGAGLAVPGQVYGGSKPPDYEERAVDGGDDLMRPSRQTAGSSSQR